MPTFSTFSGLAPKKCHLKIVIFSNICVSQFSPVIKHTLLVHIWILGGKRKQTQLSGVYLLLYSIVLKNFHPSNRFIVLLKQFLQIWYYIEILYFDRVMQYVYYCAKYNNVKLLWSLHVNYQQWTTIIFQ